MEWTTHWLEAEGDLSAWREPISHEIEAARQAAAAMLPRQRIDILVQCLPGAVIPEVGMVGHAYRKGLFSLTVDPGNPNFSHCLQDGTMRRHILHEVHHCGRMAHVGYGSTLGEALVSEGLAGRFVSALLGSPPEIWENAVDDCTLERHFPSEDELNSTTYNHQEWFYGEGGRRPRWLGYTLGYRIVGSWLNQVPIPDGLTWLSVQAEDVLARARSVISNRELRPAMGSILRR